MYVFIRDDKKFIRQTGSECEMVRGVEKNFQKREKNPTLEYCQFFEYARTHTLCTSADVSNGFTW